MAISAITETSTTETSSKGLHYGLWGAQVLLALMFGMAGFVKLSTPIEQLAQMMPWVPSVPAALVRFIGASELAGALGMILPSATRIAPKLTALAGAGLAVVMVLASLTHISRGEFSALGINFFLAALSVFVAWGRSSKAPIAAR